MSFSRKPRIASNTRAPTQVRPCELLTHPKFGFPDKIDVEDPDVSDSDGEYLVKEFEVAE